MEHCHIEQEERAIAVHTSDGKFPVPCAALLLMIGPGTTVTHAAIRALAENGCLVAWTGEEGVRFYARGLDETYARASRETGIPWKGRAWGDEQATDPLNRALSWANACLYGICHAAIVSAGYSTALGFIHSGHIRSFVFDIADLYKVEISIPIAFAVIGGGTSDLETRTRRACRDRFRELGLLERILPDIDCVLTGAEKAVPTAHREATSVRGPEGERKP